MAIPVGTSIIEAGQLLNGNLLQQIQQERIRAIERNKLQAAAQQQRETMISLAALYLQGQTGSLRALQSTPVNVVNPSNGLASSYRGTVTGSVAPKYAGWTVQAYLAVPGSAPSATPSYATVGTGGTFAVDLSTTSPTDPGDWELALLEPWTSNVIGGPVARPLNALEPEQAGLAWPQIGSIGLTLYDMAMALLAELALDNAGEAQEIASTILSQQSGSSASTGGLNYVPGYQPIFRTGAHSMAVYALLRYVLAHPDDTSQDYQDAIVAGLAWISGQLSSSGTTSGLYLGGSGEDIGVPAVVGQNNVLTNATTTDNIAAWFALTLAGDVLGDSIYLDQASALQDAIMSTLWGPAGGSKFLQAMTPSGPDNGDPLLARTWGALWLNAIVRPDLAARVISTTTLQPFEIIQFQPSLTISYAPWYSGDPSGDYAGAEPNVWLEGVAQTAYAWLVALNAPDRWGGLTSMLTAFQDTSGGFPYSTVSDSNVAYQLSTGLSVSATSWAVLTCLGFGCFE